MPPRHDNVNHYVQHRQRSLHLLATPRNGNGGKKRTATNSTPLANTSRSRSTSSYVPDVALHIVPTAARSSVERKRTPTRGSAVGGRCRFRGSAAPFDRVEDVEEKEPNDLTDLRDFIVFFFIQMSDDGLDDGRMGDGKMESQCRSPDVVLKGAARAGEVWKVCGEESARVWLVRALVRRGRGGMLAGGDGVIGLHSFAREGRERGRGAGGVLEGAMSWVGWGL